MSDTIVLFKIIKNWQNESNNPNYLWIQYCSTSPHLPNHKIQYNKPIKQPLMKPSYSASDRNDSPIFFWSERLIFRSTRSIWLSKFIFWLLIFFNWLVTLLFQVDLFQSWFLKKLFEMSVLLHQIVILAVDFQWNVSDPLQLVQ